MQSIAPPSVEFLAAFPSAKPPGDLRTPLAVRAPEAIFNHLSMLFKARIGKEIDIWSIGCLVRPHMVTRQHQLDIIKRFMNSLRQALLRTMYATRSERCAN